MHDVVVANGRWHGGAMMLAPEAEPDDGLFDVILIGDINKRDFVTTAPKIYKGTYLAHPKVELLRARARFRRGAGAAADRAGRRTGRCDACTLRGGAPRFAFASRVVLRLAAASRRCGAVAPACSPASTSGRSTTPCPACTSPGRRTCSMRSCRCRHPLGLRLGRSRRTSSRSPRRSSSRSR